jgi:nucleoside-diphosphate-sugar epimerase
MKSRKKITNLVIGSEGFVGTPLCQYLIDAGENVIRYDIKRTEAEDARKATLDLDGVDRVYFLAWDVGGSKYLYNADSQLGQMDWDLQLLLNVMPQLQAKKIPFLFVSSQLAEECDTVYGVTKRLGEVWTSHLQGVKVRLWNVYGPIEAPSAKTHVVSDMVRQAVTTGKIKLLTTGEEKRQFINIKDVCRGFHQALSKNHNQNIYDITSFEWTRVLDVAKIIAKYAKAEIITGPTVGKTPLTPLKGRLPGWLPEISLEQGIKTMVNEMKELNKKTKRGKNK